MKSFIKNKMYLKIIWRREKSTYTQVLARLPILSSYLMPLNLYPGKSFDRTEKVNFLYYYRHYNPKTINYVWGICVFLSFNVNKV